MTPAFSLADTNANANAHHREVGQDLFDRSRKARRPAITEGFVMPGFTGFYWMWPEEYALLSKYVDLTEGDYLEIGSMCGIVAMSFAKKYPSRHFLCVDAFTAGLGTIAGEKQTFLRNLREHNLKNVTLMEGDSLKVVPALTRRFDVAFIDGNHAYEYVLGDALNSWPLLESGGFIVFHDYECVEETTRAVHEFLKRTGAHLVEMASSLAVASKSVQHAQRKSSESQDESNHTLDTSGDAPFETHEKNKPPIASPALALWNQRAKIAASAARIRALSCAIGCASDFALYQWAQIAAFSLEFGPDLIIELGRHTGNSTCCFLEVANHLGGAHSCKLVSLCLSDVWAKHSVHRVTKIVAKDWFKPGDIRQCNILKQDLSAELETARKCLVFWDAHGFGVAEWVLGNLLPKLAQKPHLIAMHDISDLRYSPEVRLYGERGLWQGDNAADNGFCLGHIFSRVAQAISVFDFASRNGLTLHSAEESLHSELGNNPARLAELKQLIGEDLFSLAANWFWFTLNEVVGNITFPRFQSRGGGQAASSIEAKITALQNEARLLKEGFRQNSPPPPSQVERLEQMLVSLRGELVRVCNEKEYLEAAGQAVENSAGWRLLNSWREARERVLPVGSARRKCYDSFFSHLRK